MKLKKKIKLQILSLKEDQQTLDNYYYEDLKKRENALLDEIAENKKKFPMKERNTVEHWNETWDCENRLVEKLLNLRGQMLSNREAVRLVVNSINTLETLWNKNF